MLPVNFLPEARVDFDQSFDWYAQRSSISAERFSLAVDVAIVRIIENADYLPFVDDHHQECSLKRFPFRIIFRLMPNEIQIVALAHAKRRPNYWRNR